MLSGGCAGRFSTCRLWSRLGTEMSLQVGAGLQSPFFVVASLPLPSACSPQTVLLLTVLSLSTLLCSLLGSPIHCARPQLE